MRAVIVGGGFFGARLAVALAGQGVTTLLIEREAELLTRASAVNQGRVHQGYHYPRSVLTALRSRVNFARFVRDFEPAIDRSFTMLYAIARHGSNVTAAQFRRFCKQIEAPVKPAAPSLRRLFDSRLVEEVVEVEEFAFDATRLRELMGEALLQSRVEVRLSTTVTRVSKHSDQLTLDLSSTRGDERVEADEVFLCTYGSMNELLLQSGLPPVPLRLELAELALIEPPPELATVGVTVMCGPFFSTMPLRSRSLHTLSHVRYTPHLSWDEPGEPPAALSLRDASRRSQYSSMIHDARRFVPALGEARYVESLYELKALLPRSDRDDSRPILFQRDHALRGLTVVLGGKIDNVYDVEAELLLSSTPAVTQ